MVEEKQVGRWGEVWTNIGEKSEGDQVSSCEILGMRQQRVVKGVR